MKFKEGDKVKIVKLIGDTATEDNVYVGKVGKIVYANDAAEYPYDILIGDEDDVFSAHEEELELVK